MYLFGIRKLQSEFSFFPCIKLKPSVGWLTGSIQKYSSVFGTWTIKWLKI